jgi:hypothetical protein
MTAPRETFRQYLQSGLSRAVSYQQYLAMMLTTTQRMQ